jgi:hypothetical protein
LHAIWKFNWTLWQALLYIKLHIFTFYDFSHGHCVVYLQIKFCTFGKHEVLNFAFDLSLKPIGLKLEFTDWTWFSYWVFFELN